MDEQEIGKAREMLSGAGALLVTAGAGMGVDSGLPDFRGDEGFWKAYPPYRRLGLSFVELAKPEGFWSDPEFAWGFYGHRLDLYRKTEPHAGFGMIRNFAESLEGGCFVFTSNVDGHFQRAGFDASRVLECHGSINHLQCLGRCDRSIWSAAGLELEIDTESMRAVGDLPRCPDCGCPARPNVLMFGDGEWDPARATEQDARYREWLGRWWDGLVVLEFGAGSAVPTVRMQSETVAMAGGGLIRVNPREAAIPQGIPGVSFPAGALRACRALFPSGV